MKNESIKRAIQILEQYENEGADVIVTNIRVRKTMPTTANVTLRFDHSGRVEKHLNVQYDLHLTRQGNC